MSRPALAYLALGSNLGDRATHLERAVVELAGLPSTRLLALSPFHETAPAGGPPDQGAFLNAAAVLETGLEPLLLLRALLEIETRIGRVRTVRWGERTIDLDLLLHGDRVVDTPELTLPHPRMAVRRFVLAPLADVAPEAIHPGTGRTVADLLANLDRRPGIVGLDSESWDGPTHRAVRDGLVAALGGDGWDVAEPWLSDGQPPRERPTFVAIDARPGDGRAASPPTIPSLPVAADDADAIVAEILAACRASRP